MESFQNQLKLAWYLTGTIFIMKKNYVWPIQYSNLKYTTQYLSLEWNNFESKKKGSKLLLKLIMMKLLNIHINNKNRNLLIEYDARKIIECDFV